MLLYSSATKPNALDLRALAAAQDRRSPIFHAKYFIADSVRPYPSFDVTSVVVRSKPEGRTELPWVIAVRYSSRQRRPNGEFLLELRTESSFSEIHLSPSGGEPCLTAGPFFGKPNDIVSAKLYANDLDPEDSLVLHHLSLTRQYDPEAIVPEFRYGDEAYNFRGRSELEARARDLMAECLDRMMAMRETERIEGNSGQDAILPFVMEYSHRRFPHIVGNLNGLYWYALTQHQYLEHMSTASGMLPGDVVFDCGSHTGYVAHAMVALGGDGTKVICFDPFPQNNFLTDLNRRLTGFDIEVAHAGVGRETKSVLASNSHQIMVEPENVPCKEYPLMALDDLLAYKPSFLKIDVEGFELEALLGAQKILRDLRPRVFIELHPQFFGMTKASYRKIYEAFPEGRYKFVFHHAEKYDDTFEQHLDTQPLGNLYAEPI